MKKTLSLILCLLLTLSAFSVLAEEEYVKEFESTVKLQAELFSNFESLCLEGGIMFADIEYEFYDMTTAEPPKPYISTVFRFFDKTSVSFNFSTETKSIEKLFLGLYLLQPYVKTNKKILVSNFLKAYISPDDKETFLIVDYLFNNLVFNKEEDRKESSIKKYGYTITLDETEYDFIAFHVLSLRVEPEQ